MSEETQNSSDNSLRAPQLKPFHFQPGQSGNPGGRPKKKPITEMFERILDNEQNADEIQEAVRQIFNQKSGMAKVLLLEKMADRLEGKVSQQLEVSGELAILSLSERMQKARAKLKE